MNTDTIKPTPQQKQAMSLILNFLSNTEDRIFILKGYAGTGKTTLIRSVVQYLIANKLPVNVMAPTGRAARILRDKLSDIIEPCRISTIHKAIYEFAHIVEKEADGILQYCYPVRDNPSCNRIYIIDEASMISSRRNTNEILHFGTDILINDLLTYTKPHSGGKIIFVGDPMQLPPVEDNRSCALDEAFFKDLGLRCISYELTDVLRQGKDNAILSNALMLRDLIKEESRNTLVFKRREGEVMNLASCDVAQSFCSGTDSSSAVICYSNRQASEYNTAIRNILYPGATHPVPGDRLIVVNNNYSTGYGLFNGDMITVLEVSEKTHLQSAPVWIVRDGKRQKETVSLTFREISFQTEDGNVLSQFIIDSLLDSYQPGLTVDEIKAMYINAKMRAVKNGMQTNMDILSFIRNDRFFNALHVKYGYAFTCHKAQGGEWETVYVDFSRRTGLDADALRWKYTAVTRAVRKLFCVNLPDITPISTLNVAPIIQTSKIPENAFALSYTKETPWHQEDVPASVKNKYWSVSKAMEGTSYSIASVICKPWRDIYTVKTPDGTSRVDLLYNKSGIFTKISADSSVMPFFIAENNDTEYSFDYIPESTPLKNLYRHMLSLCNELGITLTNVTENPYQVVYHLKTTADYASVTFFYDKNGFITHAAPLSLIGDSDKKLQRLTEQLKKDKPTCQ